ncbi:hypothetical protein SynA15127_01822 [Synechococcus sp. A15-127]|nr:hypothetical protein [Synechococcus sp. A15-127]QNI94897.1 hypothetical protein SynA15127_01822 [Synechococcus sp. A15-127]
MRRFITSLSEQQIRHGYSLLALMEHLDRELETSGFNTWLMERRSA